MGSFICQEGLVLKPFISQNENRLLYWRDEESYLVLREKGHRRRYIQNQDDNNQRYDRKYKKWLEMQYRLGVSSDYFSKTDINVLMDGMFITKIRIVKNIYLTHRAILKADLVDTPFRPYYKQTILLSFSKSF